MKKTVEKVYCDLCTGTIENKLLGPYVRPISLYNGEEWDSGHNGDPQYGHDSIDICYSCQIKMCKAIKEKSLVFEKK